jgi:hypothetical protein
VVRLILEEALEGQVRDEIGRERYERAERLRHQRGGRKAPFTSRSGVTSPPASSKRIVLWLTGNPHIRSVNSFRLIRGPLARGASACATHDIYLDVALHWFTRRIQTITMELKDTPFITTKKSGYRYRSLLSHARRLLMWSQIKMLRMGIAFGFVVTATSVVTALLLLAIRVFMPESINAVGWTSLMITVMFFGGVKLDSG